MNERHEQLLAQAHIEFAPDAKAVTKRFAELIIEQCITKVILRREFAIEDQHNVDEAFSMLIYDIEAHFGIE